MRKRRKTSATRTVSAETFAKIAAEAVPAHEMLLGEGHQLAPGSRLWRRKDGTWTARFIYARKEGGLTTKFVVTVQGLLFA